MSQSGFNDENTEHCVKDLATQGISRQDICFFAGITSEEELENQFGGEIRKASIETSSKVAATLLEMAVSGKNAAATTFWLRARSGWSLTSAERERVGVESRKLGFEPYPDADQPGLDEDR